VIPARVLGLGDSLGVIETGMLADLVLLEADPLEDIRHVRRVAAVVLRGRYLDRSALDGLGEGAGAGGEPRHRQ
jgi:imidazolonepropionase-like amidohydrolase